MGDTVHTILLQEAQKEIASLRSELYSTRRIAEERRQATEQFSHSQEALLNHVAQLQEVIKQQSSELERYSIVEKELIDLRLVHTKLQKDFEISTNARKILESELFEERKHKAQLEEVKITLESERSRLQRSRDDLVAQLRLAKQGKEEAEEEVIRAEEELAAARIELASAHQSIATSSAPIESTLNFNAFKEQLESERSRAATLLSSLRAAKAEITSLSQKAQLADLQQIELESLQTEVETLRAEVQAIYARAATSSQPAVPSDHEKPELAEDAISKDLTLIHAQNEIGTLQAKIFELKSSRDKLLREIDMQWEDIDRLTIENKSLADELAKTRVVARQWQLHAQLGLQQNDKLKEFLEESARWGNKTDAALESSGMQLRDVTLKEGKDSNAVISSLQENLVEAQAKVVDVEIQAAALAAELTRSRHANLDIGKSVLPLLVGVESRLLGMLSHAKEEIVKYGRRPSQNL